MKNEKGFTLIELVIVIAIMGIIASIGLPKLANYREQAKINTLKTNTHTLEQYVQYLAILEGLSFEYKPHDDGADDDDYDTYMSLRIEKELEKDLGSGSNAERYLNRDGYVNLYSGFRYVLNGNYLSSVKNPAVYITSSDYVPAEPIEDLKGSIVIEFPDGESVEIFYVDFDGNESPHKVIER